MSYEAQFDCGCRIWRTSQGNLHITYCPKHAAAPEMFEALKVVSDFAAMAVDESVNIIEAFEYIDSMTRKCQAALELATGDSDG